MGLIYDLFGIGYDDEGYDRLGFNSKGINRRGDDRFGQQPEKTEETLLNKYDDVYNHNPKIKNTSNLEDQFVVANSEEGNPLVLDPNFYNRAFTECNSLVLRIDESYTSALKLGGIGSDTRFSSEFIFVNAISFTELILQQDAIGTNITHNLTSYIKREHRNYLEDISNEDMSLAQEQWQRSYKAINSICNKIFPGASDEAISKVAMVLHLSDMLKIEIPEAFILPEINRFYEVIQKAFYDSLPQHIRDQKKQYKPSPLDNHTIMWLISTITSMLNQP